MQSQKGALSHADELFTRMRELAHEASSGMISQKQRDILSNEFNALKGLVTELSNETINGVNLFDSRASSIKYDINFDSAFDASIPHDGVESGWKYWDVKKDTLYNYGIMQLDISPGGAGDRFILHQGDSSKPIFDTGIYTTPGHATKFDFDRYIIEYDSNTGTKFKFEPLSTGNSSSNTNPDNYFDNKSYYLNHLLGSNQDPENGLFPSSPAYNSTSGWDSRLNTEYTNSPSGKIKTIPPDPNTTNLHLRVYSNTWFDMRASWSLPELEKQIVGNPSDAQVQLNQLGLGLMRENDGDKFTPVSINTIEDAKVAFEVMGEELANVQSQFGKISSNMSRVESSINIAESNIGGSEKTLSQITNAGLEDDALAISKSRIYRSKSAALLTQAMSVNQDVANFLL